MLMIENTDPSAQAQMLQAHVRDLQTRLRELQDELHKLSQRINYVLNSMPKAAHDDAGAHATTSSGLFPLAVVRRADGKVMVANVHPSVQAKVKVTAHPADRTGLSANQFYERAFGPLSSEVVEIPARYQLADTRIVVSLDDAGRQINVTEWTY